MEKYVIAMAPKPGEPSASSIAQPPDCGAPVSRTARRPMSTSASEASRGLQAQGACTRLNGVSSSAKPGQ